jgi:hypothetical protein
MTTQLPRPIRRQVIDRLPDDLRKLAEKVGPATDAAKAATERVAELEKQADAAHAADAIALADALDAGVKVPRPTEPAIRLALADAWLEADALGELAARRRQEYATAVISGSAGNAWRSESKAQYDEAIAEAYAAVGAIGVALKRVGEASIDFQLADGAAAQAGTPQFEMPNPGQAGRVATPGLPGSYLSVGDLVDLLGECLPALPAESVEADDEATAAA